MHTSRVAAPFTLSPPSITPTVRELATSLWCRTRPARACNVAVGFRGVVVGVEALPGVLAGVLAGVEPGVAAGVDDGDVGLLVGDVGLLVGVVGFEVGVVGSLVGVGENVGGGAGEVVGGAKETEADCELSGSNWLPIRPTTKATATSRATRVVPRGRQADLVSAIAIGRGAV